MGPFEKALAEAAVEVDFAQRCGRLSSQALQCGLLQFIAKLLAPDVDDEDPTGAEDVLRCKDRLGVSGRGS